MRGLNVRALSKSFCHRPYLWLLGIALFTLPAGYLSSRLTVQSDFKKLLPTNKTSVQSLDKLIARVGGISNLLIAIECDDHRATEKFIEDLVKRLKKLPPKYVRFVEYNSSDLKSFYESNKYLYIDLVDLQSIHDRLARKIRYEKLHQNPFFIALDEDRVDFDVSDIEAKYRNKTSKYDGYINGYYFGEGGKLAAIEIQPYGTSTGTGFAKDLIGRVQAIVQDLNPQSYHPTMVVKYAGKFQSTLDEYHQLIADVMETLALCLILVSLALYLYFLRLRVIWLLAGGLVVGTVWTFALTQLKIGYLNSQTAFLGSIIVGNGVNSGIILLARFLELRRGKQTLENALVQAIEDTWLGTFIAAATTSAGFAAMGFSEIKGFSQFGFIGGFGMTLCWIATYITVPPLLVLSERIWPMVSGEKFVSKQWESLMKPVGALVTRAPKFLVGLSILLALGSGYAMYRFIPTALEYDFSKLKNKPKDASEGPSVSTRVREIFGAASMSPVVILLDDEKQADFVCKAVMAKEATYADGEKTIDSCKTLQSYLPADQDQKLVVLAKIRKVLADNSLNFLKAEHRKQIDDFRRDVNLRRLSMSDLPDTVKRRFQELDGTIGRFAYVYPRPDANLNNGKRLMKFTDVLSAIKLEDGSTVQMSGEGAIFADLLRAVTFDGPLASLLAFFAVASVVAITFRRIRPTVYVLGGLVVGVIYMFGLGAAFDIKYNFFNFIALPVTFGIGVDYGVNLLQRYRVEGPGSVRRVLAAWGGAIILCSITTLIGYATLLTAQNQALASFGWLGLIGEITCVFVAILVMPAILHLYDRRHRSEEMLASAKKVH